MVVKMKKIIKLLKDFFLKKYKLLYNKFKYTNVKIQSKESDMPMGKGTYGSKKGRPPKKKSGNGLTAKQKTLPSALQKKIMKAKKKKK